MMNHHTVTFYPGGGIGVRSTEDAHTAVLTADKVHLTDVSDLKSLTLVRLLTLHNHLAEREDVRAKRIDAAMPERTWAMLRTAPPIPIKGAPPTVPDPAMLLDEPEPTAAKVQEQPAPRAHQRVAVDVKITTRPTTPRGSVKATTEALLRRAEGASKAEILEALGAAGNDNTVRGMLSALGHTTGLALVKSTDPRRGTVYRLTEAI